MPCAGRYQVMTRGWDFLRAGFSFLRVIILVQEIELYEAGETVRLYSVSKLGAMSRRCQVAGKGNGYRM